MGWGPVLGCRIVTSNDYVRTIAGISNVQLQGAWSEAVHVELRSSLQQSDHTVCSGTFDAEMKEGRGRRHSGGRGGATVEGRGA